MTPPSLDAWAAWSPEVVAGLLERSGACWYVGGGWAVDLHLGRTTREHEDLEIATIAADRSTVLASLGPLSPWAAWSGKLVPLADGDPLPEDCFQTWLHEEAAGAWRVDVMLELGDAETWVYRREPSITAPRSSMVAMTPSGIPYLLPHGVLLFKGGREVRPKDELDFAVLAPVLTPDERAWLVEHLGRLRPDHPWLGRLGTV